jgi:two-component system CheB/CheR fusion protein
VSDQASGVTGLRILVVDDNPDAVEMMSIALTYSGALVSSAMSVDDAMTFDLREFDVVITDLSMPRRSGYDLLTLVRDRASSVPVIAVSGQSLYQESERRSATPFARYLRKPVEHTELLRAIQEVTDQRNRRSATE